MEDKKDIKTLNLDVDYKVPAADLADLRKVPSAVEMSEDYINSAGATAWPRGLDGQKRRVWGRIQRKIADVVEAGKKLVELDPTEVAMLKEAFAKGTFGPQYSKYVVILEDIINSL